MSRAKPVSAAQQFLNVAKRLVRQGKPGGAFLWAQRAVKLAKLERRPDIVIKAMRIFR